MMLKLYTLLATLRITLLNDVAALNSGFTFNPQNFVENLKYMGLGMLAIFIVIGVIVGITYLLNALFQDKNK
ncbi:MAG: hypothetical protein J6W14_01825 [Clostridia bacterium]|nr:hypothetical protein [Clostridia bacterium]